MSTAETEVPSKPANTIAVTGFVLGIAAFLLGLVPVLGLVLAASALVFSFIAALRKQKKSFYVVGLILGCLSACTAIIVTLMFLPTISVAPESPEGPSESLIASRSEVDWNKYEPDLKQKLDSLAELADCEMLQREFDRFFDGSETEQNKTGTNNVSLLVYIDSAMRASGCYTVNE